MHGRVRHIALTTEMKAIKRMPELTANAKIHGFIITIVIAITIAIAIAIAIIIVAAIVNRGVVSVRPFFVIRVLYWFLRKHHAASARLHLRGIVCG